MLYWFHASLNYGRSIITITSDLWYSRHSGNCPGSFYHITRSSHELNLTYSPTERFTMPTAVYCVGNKEEKTHHPRINVFVSVWPIVLTAPKMTSKSHNIHIIFTSTNNRYIKFLIIEVFLRYRWIMLTFTGRWIRAIFYFHIHDGRNSVWELPTQDLVLTIDDDCKCIEI